jgi:hypothetical protein
MAEQFLVGSIAAPGFFGLNKQDSSIQLNSGFALQAENCVIDRFGRIGSRKGWEKVNSSAASTGSFKALFELVLDDGNVLLSAANNKLYTGTTTLTEQKVIGTTKKTGTYSQTGTTATITITSHGYSNGAVVYLNFTSGTAVDGFYTVASAATNTFTVTVPTGTTSGNVESWNTVSYSITDDDWQMAGMPFDTGATPSGHAVVVQSGHPALVYHKVSSTGNTHDGPYGFQRLGDVATNLPGTYTASTFQPNCVLTAFGRTWVADIAGDRQTVYFSDLLNPKEWKTGTSGYLNISEVVPNNDPIVALAAHNGFLVIFCQRHIVIYANPQDPSAMTLSDTISGAGCIARDSVASVAGTDILFLSAAGVLSFQRTVQEKSLPFRDVSKNVRDELVQAVNGEDVENIKAVYFSTEAFYLLSLPASKIVYCFDTRGTLQDGSARVTTWAGLVPTAFVVTQARKLYVGQAGYIGEYTGYTDNEQAYRMSYYTNYFDFDQPAIIKILKKINMVAIGGSSQPITMKWSFDYSFNYNSQTVILNGSEVYEYGIAEYGIAEYSTGISLENVKANLGGSGKILQLGFETDVNGVPVSIQKLDFSLKAGKNLI